MANAIKQGSSIVVKNSLFALLGLILLSRPLAATAQQFGDFTYSSDGSAIALTGYPVPAVRCLFQPLSMACRSP